MFDRRDFAGALARFDEAYALFPAPGIQFNRAQALHALGRNAEAVQALERFLKEAKDISAEKRAEAEQDLATIRSQLAAERPAAPAQAPKTAAASPTSTVTAVPSAPASPAPPATAASAPASPAPPATATTSAPPPRAVPPEAGLVASAEQRGPVEPQPAARAFSHQGQLGLSLRTDVNASGGWGVVVIPGVTYGATRHLEVGIGALIGFYKGAAAEAAMLLGAGRWKAVMGMRVPAFFVDGVQIGLQPTAGVIVDLNAHFGIAAELTVAYFPFAPDDMQTLWLVPSIRSQIRF